jgi:DNA/RNA-binding domain of Phe-tRNA-synthetase-like protein
LPPSGCEVAAELPGLRLDWVTLRARPGRSSPALGARLRRLADRFRGASVVTMRTKPIHHAYRAFYRQIGLDPDVERTPAERAAVQRLLHGGFACVDLITDACLIALLETGVPVWALDADVIDEQGLGIRTTTAEDVTADGRVVTAGHVEPGSLAVVDGTAVHARLFADPVPAAAPRSPTTRVALYSVAVAGVPAIHVEESLWICVDLIGGDDPAG